jgi:hypothetical protein
MSVNKNSRFIQIGIDRLVRLKWLTKTASLLLAGNEDSVIKAVLQDDLKKSFRSENCNVRGSIDKSITILLKIWVRTPRELESLRKSGLDLIKNIDRTNQIAVHWGMVMAVYPFWGSVAIQVGRLLKLQGSVVASQVQRRMREQYGERETVSRRARYVLRSFVDWGLLKETSKKGIYTNSTPLAIDDSRLIAWLVEASLHARSSGSAQLKELLASPALFPFQLKPVNAKSLLAASTNIDITRYALNDDLVMLRKAVPY